MSASLTTSLGWAKAGRSINRATMANQAARRKRQRISEAHTAVSFSEQHECEVFSPYGVFLTRAPQHGRATERLAALAVGLLGVRNGISELRLVRRLVHCRQ